MGVLIKPIVTERATLESEATNRFSFFVDPKANKLEIKHAVASHYGVTVDKVWTQRYKGKPKSRFSKSGPMKGRRNHLKKAVVALAQGDTIDFYSNL